LRRWRARVAALVGGLLFKSPQAEGGDHELLQPLAPLGQRQVDAWLAVDLEDVEDLVDERRPRPALLHRREARAAVLVEGVSYPLALAARARHGGRNLAAEGISIVSIGGATNIGRFLDRCGPRGLDLRLAGLCDAGEEGDFQRGLERAGLGSNLTRAGMEGLGFYVCVADLEDELIRALGAPAVQQVIEAAGELESFRTFQKQPAWRGRTDQEQLRRFFGTHGGRKIQSAASLVNALDLGRVPRPLERVLAHV